METTSQSTAEKKIIWKTISGESVRDMDVAKLQSILFAEIGAQGEGAHVALASDNEDSIEITEGTFGFEIFDKHFDGDVDIKRLEAKLPFLVHFLGTSPDDTKRGNFLLAGENWLHLDFGMGTHFFIRPELFDEFRQTIVERDIGDYRSACLDIVAGLLKTPRAGNPTVSPCWLGAITGDIAGSRFEFHNRKTKEFSLLAKPGEESHHCFFTDDSVMTLAIADALLRWRAKGTTSLSALSKEAVKSMRIFGRRYPQAGYGGAFRRWLNEERPEPYNSWGNGAAMRVSACGWVAKSLEEAIALSDAVTRVTHDHPEGLKGAAATAACVFLARTGKSKDEIRQQVEECFYRIDFVLDEIRPTYTFDVSCQGSVPQALEAFFESTSFEDAIRNAVSIGGDSDTIAAIAGAVAGAFYGIPDAIQFKTKSFLDPFLSHTADRFARAFSSRRQR